MSIMDPNQDKPATPAGPPSSSSLINHANGRRIDVNNSLGGKSFTASDAPVVVATPTFRDVAERNAARAELDKMQDDPTIDSRIKEARWRAYWKAPTQGESSVSREPTEADRRQADIEEQIRWTDEHGARVMDDVGEAVTELYNNEAQYAQASGHLDVAAKAVIVPALVEITRADNKAGNLSSEAIEHQAEQTLRATWGSNFESFLAQARAEAARLPGGIQNLERWGDQHGVWSSPKKQVALMRALLASARARARK